MALLKNNPDNDDWHLFEGSTRLDVFIQTPHTIIVIEGKRTERGPTTKTKWMAGRHQMVRHIECAREIAGSRRVVGFFVVEANGNDCQVPSNWIDFARKTIEPAAVSSSLPHRTIGEQKAIASCFAGVTTWQRLRLEFDLQ